MKHRFDDIARIHQNRKARQHELQRSGEAAAKRRQDEEERLRLAEAKAKHEKILTNVTPFGGFSGISSILAEFGKAVEVKKIDYEVELNGNHITTGERIGIITDIINSNQRDKIELFERVSLSVPRNVQQESHPDYGTIEASYGITVTITEDGVYVNGSQVRSITDLINKIKQHEVNMDYEKYKEDFLLP